MKRTTRHDVDKAERQLRRCGIHVKELGRNELHDYGGMNSEAARAMGWKSGRNEIDVSEDSSNTRKVDDLRHEAFEYQRMRMGVPYAQAHVEALKVEGASGVTPATMVKIPSYPKNATIVRVHDDGDITYRDRSGILHIKTTSGKDFKEVRGLKSKRVRIPR